MQSFYLSPPATWPFKSPTIPAKLMPSRNSYVRNAQGLVLVDQADLSTLLGLGFYLYGSTPNLRDFVSQLDGSGDATKYLNAAGGLSTPATGGSGGLIRTSRLLADSPNWRISLPVVGYSSYSLRLIGFQMLQNGEDVFCYRLSFDGGVTFPDNLDYQSSVVYNYHNGVDVAARTIEYFLTQGVIADGYPSQIATPHLSFCGDINIFPGSDTLYPMLWGSNISVQSDNGTTKGFAMQSSCAFAGRATDILLSTYIGDGGDIAAGAVYALFGIPNPS